MDMLLVCVWKVLFGTPRLQYPARQACIKLKLSLVPCVLSCSLSLSVSLLFCLSLLSRSFSLLISEPLWRDDFGPCSTKCSLVHRDSLEDLLSRVSSQLPLKYPVAVKLEDFTHMFCPGCFFGSDVQGANTHIGEGREANGGTPATSKLIVPLPEVKHTAPFCNQVAGHHLEAALGAYPPS